MRDLLLFLSTPLLTYIFAVVFLVLWNRDRALCENLALSAGWALLGTGFLISLLSPDHWGRAIVAITFVPYTLAAVCISWGILTRVRITPPVAPQLAVAAVGSAVMALTQAFGDSVVADIYVANTTCGVIMVMTAQLFAGIAKRDTVERFLLVMLLLTAANFFVRPVLSLMFDGPVAAAAYRDTIYYLALNWVFAFGSVLFGLAQISGAIKDQLDRLRHTASTDILSGLLVRGEFEARVDAALIKASSERRSVALVVSDIDHFKQVNDIWGHQVGDRAIAEFGQLIGRMIRPHDIAGRIGGEEFCILVWDADETVAMGLAERLRVALSQVQVEGMIGKVHLTASFGTAGCNQGESYRSIFARADKALYSSKKEGRNRVTSALGSPEVSSSNPAPDQGNQASKAA